MGISSPVNGLIALPPVGIPRLGLSSAVRSNSLWLLTSLTNAATADCCSAVVTNFVNGCSGAKTT